MANLLLSPLSYCWLGVAWLLFGATRRLSRWLRVVPGLIAGLSLWLMTPLGANLLVQAIESRVPAPSPNCLAYPPATIVVLGGGFGQPPESDDDFGALSTASSRRLFSAVRLLERQPGSKLVITGGGPYGVAESTAMGGLALHLGVPADRLRLETRSMTTVENIDRLATLQPPVERRISLVSSALHLPRAITTAERAGFTVCPAPSDSLYLPPGGFGYYFPQSSALAKSEAALHELAGSALYAWRAAAPTRPATARP